MKRRFATILLGMSLALSLGGSLLAKDYKHEVPDRPKIVIGMVVDQMSWDYLYRFSDRFGEGGFKRLLNEGFNCHNARINYIPSVTAIGHATVYTGSVPSIHGIAGNNFFEGKTRRYCTEDKSVHTVGAEEGKSGQMSPRNMRSTSITDELKLATNFRSKVVGVAIKDRGAILPAGHSADAAYWFDDKSGRFITSTYYMQELPRWVRKFNDRELPERYLRAGWKPVHAVRSYTQSLSDENPFEEPWGQTAKATLPLDTKKLMKEQGFGVIRTTPMGNTLTLDMAKAAIEGENLGKKRRGEEHDTDFLAISLSSTDYIGHRYAPLSVEIEDTYLHLDKDLKRFFDYLDERYGRDGYLFFLTADHAAGHNLTFLEHAKLPGRAWRSDEARLLVDSVCRAQLGEVGKSVAVGVANNQIFFDEEAIDRLGADRHKLFSSVKRAIDRMPGVAYTIIMDEASTSTVPQEIRERAINGYTRGRSGALFVILHPGWYSHGSAEPALGTSHSVWAPYDTHIPLIFMGHRIKPAHLYREVHMTDIAATLAMYLKTQLPSGCIGKPIHEILGED